MVAVNETVVNILQERVNRIQELASDCSRIKAAEKGSKWTPQERNLFHRLERDARKLLESYQVGTLTRKECGLIAGFIVDKTDVLERPENKERDDHYWQLANELESANLGL